MTREATLSLTYEQRPDTGEDPTLTRPIALTLSGYTKSAVREITLGAAEELSVALTSSVYVMIESTNGESFKFRAREDEQQLSNVYVIVLGGVDATDEVLAAGSIVLEGNGTNQAEITITTIETAT